MPCVEKIRPFDPTDLIDLLAHLHAAVDEIEVTATSLIHLCSDREAGGRLYLTALALQAIYDKVLARLEALEAELERRGV